MVSTQSGDSCIDWKGSPRGKKKSGFWEQGTALCYKFEILFQHKYQKSNSNKNKRGKIFCKVVAKGK